MSWAMTEGTIASVKFLHIAALSVWCAGLVALPLMLALHDPDSHQHFYMRLRIVTHAAYTRVVTPAAVIAIAAGAVLIFLRETWVPWFFAKLLFVGVLALFHAWVGHITLLMGERHGVDHAPPAWPVVIGTLITVVVILVLVLAKPAIPTDIIPDWLGSPRHQSLPIDEVPI